ncbi:MAG: glutamate-5-semialdehyde dehydrogenase [Eubacterium sp.]|nr:glutamate-5-semialdehyde dehydrogenase [Eubacterium sp.]
MTTQEILIQARQTKTVLMLADPARRNQALFKMADALLEPANRQRIQNANDSDLQAAKGAISDVMLDRLLLTKERIQAMADGIRETAALDDPVGNVLSETVRPNGLVIRKTAVPIGVIAIIYESRPNVTSDAAALAIKSGNVCVLRGGKEAWRTCHAIVQALQDGLEAAGMPRTAVNLIEDTTRVSANELMTAEGYVDLLIPRGGSGLIRSCVEHATVPCIQTGTGICHIYVDKEADLSMAVRIIENAKTSRPSVCNAQEVCLVHEHIASRFLPMLRQALCENRAENEKQPVELRLDAQAATLIQGTPAKETDFDTEFLDYILAVKIVDSTEEAIEHINAHSTGHSEAILTSNAQTAAQFTSAVDSAAVYVNASTRFTDGGEFGLGCEMGISTQKLHARGPMGLAELCTYKYVIHGNGQIRP